MTESIHGEMTASELRDRVTELIEQQTAISEVLRAIANSPHDLQPIFDAILDSATRLCRADVSTLRLSEESGLRQVAVRGDPLLVSRVWSSFAVVAKKGSIPYRLAEGRLPTHIPDMTTIDADLQDDVWAKVVDAGFRTGLSVPLLIDNELIGVLGRAEHRCSRSPTNRFPYLWISLRKSPLPWRAPVASGNIARCRASLRMPTASLPWASSPLRSLPKSRNRSPPRATPPARL